MSVKRAMRLQFRVREDAPDVVKNCAAIFLSDYCGRTASDVASSNYQCGLFKTLDQIITSDTDVHISVLDTYRDKTNSYAVYQFKYKNNKYKTFRVSNTSIHDNISEVMQNKALVDKIRDWVRKYSAIFPDEDEPMSELQHWYIKQFGEEASRLRLSKYILARPVPCYITDTDTLNDKDLDYIYNDLRNATKAYLGDVGWSVGKHYINNQYVPDCQDSKVKIVHQNLSEHPNMNAVAVLYGIQMNDNYYYGGHWLIVDLPEKMDCRILNNQCEILDHWIRDKVDNYINYMKQEGMENIRPVYMDT